MTSASAVRTWRVIIASFPCPIGDRAGGGYSRVGPGEGSSRCRARGEADLPEEALGAEGGGELGVENLEGDRAVVLRSWARKTVAMPPRPSSRSNT